MYVIPAFAVEIKKLRSLEFWNVNKNLRNLWQSAYKVQILKLTKRTPIFLELNLTLNYLIKSMLDIRLLFYSHYLA